MHRKTLGFVLLVILIGAMLGSLLGSGLAYILPEGVVKEFFLRSVDFSLGGLLGLDDAIKIDLLVVQLIIGLKISLNFAAIFGLAAAYYFLRYFR
ncbi:MAG: DUF4321 domain-containing protein [Fidelibacterota bacterium]